MSSEAARQRQDYLNWTSAQVPLFPPPAKTLNPFPPPAPLNLVGDTGTRCCCILVNLALTPHAQVQQWLVLLNLPHLVQPFDNGDIDGRCLLR